jgi:type I restriction enzyme R subunit
MSSGYTESVVEQAVLAWIESAGWRVRNGTGIAPGEPAARRDAYGQVVMARRLRESLLPLACSDQRRMAAARLTGRTL